MATEDIDVRILANDQTAAAIRSAAANFDALLAKMNITGREAEKMAREFGTTLGRSVAQNIQGMDSQTRAMLRTQQDHKRQVDRTADAMGSMVGQFLTWGTAIEGARRAFGRFGDIDAQMRMIQNRTGATKQEIESLTPSFRRVARETATAFDDVVKGFNQLRAEGQLPLAQTRDMMETIARAAKGIGISVEDAGAITGTIIRQFHVAPQDIGKAWDMMARATREYGLSLDQAIAQMPELTTAAKALGYSGAEGLSRLLFYMGSVRRETGSTSEAVHALKTLMELGPSENMATFLDRDVKTLRETLKNAKDPVAELIGMIRYAIEFQGRDLLSLPVKLQGPIKQLMKDYMSLYTETNKLKEAFGEAEDAGKRMGAGPKADLDMLREELDKTVTKVGELLATFNTLGKKQGDRSHLGDFIQDIDTTITDLNTLVTTAQATFQELKLPEWVSLSWLDNFINPIQRALNGLHQLSEYILNRGVEPKEQYGPAIPKELLTPQPAKPIYNLPPGVPAPPGTYDPKELRTPPGVPAIPPTRAPITTPQVPAEQTPRAVGPSQTPSRPSMPGGRIEGAWQQEYENRARTPNAVGDSWEAEIKSRQEAERRMQRLNDELRRAAENFTRINFEMQEMRRGTKEGGGEGEGDGGGGGEGGGPGRFGGTAGTPNIRYGGQRAARSAARGGGRTVDRGGFEENPAAMPSGRTTGALGGPTQLTSLTRGQSAFLRTLSGRGIEGANYNTIVGGRTFSDFSRHPNVVGVRTALGPSTAAGRYQFTNSTWNRLVNKYGRDVLPDFSPQTQDKAAILLAREDYARRAPGRSFDADVEAAASGDAGAAEALRKGLGGSGENTTWQGLQRVAPRTWATRLQQAAQAGNVSNPTALGTRDQGGLEANRASGNVQQNLNALNQVMQGARAEGADITSSYRPPGHNLSRANPRSAHSQGRAFDLRARTAEQADAAMAAQRARFAKMGLEEGTHYRIKDEVRNPAPWATGPHVHVQLTPAGVQALRERGQGAAQPGPEASRAQQEAQGPPAPPARPARSPNDPLPGQGRPEQPGRVSGLDEAKQVRAELEEPIRLNFAREPGSEQFARSSLRRQADREMRDARMNSFTDIGAA